MTVPGLQRTVSAVLSKLNILGRDLICEEREAIRGDPIEEEEAAAGLQEGVQTDAVIDTVDVIQGRAPRAEISESV